MKSENRALLLVGKDAQGLTVGDPDNLLGIQERNVLNKIVKCNAKRFF